MAFPAAAIAEVEHPAGERARYEVTLASLQPLRFRVAADLPIDGDRLIMDESWPAELPAMANGGWPALIADLEMQDGAGNPVVITAATARGWRLARPISGRVQLSYSVDFGIFAAAGWSSPLESAIADEDHAVAIGRALFIATDRVKQASIAVHCPAGWRPVAPWPAAGHREGSFLAASLQDLTDNMLVISRPDPDLVQAAGFSLQITAMGHWRPLRPAVRSALHAIISREVAMMGYAGREVYNVVLLPTPITGGEAYRQTFVYGFENPSMANRMAWANTMAHEIFHYWNYARLRGADYASTQWFQEGFTEYVANLTILGARIASPADFRARLGAHIANYRRLTTTLEAIGTHKGPPLYSAGALVAFAFDVTIRQATGGRSTIGTFFRNLWRATGGGSRAYGWPDLEAALRMTAPADWAGFHQRYIAGHEPLPLDHVFALAGLELRQMPDGSTSVIADPAASAAAKLLWRRLVTGA